MKDNNKIAYWHEENQKRKKEAEEVLKRAKEKELNSKLKNGTN